METLVGVVTAVTSAMTGEDVSVVVSSEVVVEEPLSLLHQEIIVKLKKIRRE